MEIQHNLKDMMASVWVSSVCVTEGTVFVYTLQQQPNVINSKWYTQY